MVSDFIHTIFCVQILVPECVSCVFPLLPFPVYFLLWLFVCYILFYYYFYYLILFYYYFNNFIIIFYY